MFNVELCFVCDNATLTYVYTLSSQRNSDLLRSVGQSQTSNVKPKLKDMASGHNFVPDPTAPASWD